jgi:hypothetical protein
VEDGGDHFVVNATVATIERELGFPVHSFRSKENKRMIVKATGYKLPAYLHDVEIITGLTELPLPVRQRPRVHSNNKKRQASTLAIIPQYLRMLYNISSASLASSTTVCVAEFEVKNLFFFDSKFFCFSNLCLGLRWIQYQ